MSQRENQRCLRGLSRRNAPWRRAARPLAILFSLQLSGIGCAARPPELPVPSRPDDVTPYLEVYEDQLEGEGMSSETVRDYISGRRETPLVADDGTDTEAADAPPSPASRSGQRSEPTFKVVDGVAEYRIGSGDVVRLTSYLGPEEPRVDAHQVLSDGTIFIARFDIGAVQAAGLTPTELTRVLTGAFRQYVPSGYVEARVDEYHAWQATLSGAIRITNADGPGSYPLEGRVTVSEFIYSHGGPTDQSDLTNVRVLRGGGEQRVNVNSVLAGAIEDPPLFAGDMVYVPSLDQGSSRVFVFGEIRQPGDYPYNDGATVLDAIAQAGGYTQTASRSAVYISRPATQEVIPVDLDVLLGTGQAGSAPTLLEGDVIVVPYSPDRSQLIRDWVGIFGVVLSALTIIELVRR